MAKRHYESEYEIKAVEEEHSQTPLLNLNKNGLSADSMDRQGLNPEPKGDTYMIQRLSSFSKSADNNSNAKQITNMIRRYELRSRKLYRQ